MFSQGSSGSSERRKGRLPSDEGREDASDDAVLAQGVRDNQLTPPLRDASASPDETAQGERMSEAAGKAGAASGGQSREESFVGRRAERRAGSPRRFRAEAKDARSVHLGDGLSVGARERPRSGLLPVASRSSTPPVAQREDGHTPLASTAIFRIKSVTPLVGFEWWGCGVCPLVVAGPVPMLTW